MLLMKVKHSSMGICHDIYIFTILEMSGVLDLNIYPTTYL